MLRISLARLESTSRKWRSCEVPRWLDERHPEVAGLAEREMVNPARLSDRRRVVAGEMFYRPGHATRRAVALVDELVHHRVAPSPARRAQEHEAAGDL